MSKGKPRQTVLVEHGLRTLTADAKMKWSPPDPNPKSLKLEEIHLLPSVFQPRTISDNPLASERHITVLAAAICNETTHNLDPMTIWWSGRSWYIVDGHHRYNAYIKTNKNGKLKIDAVSVEVFQGSIDEAMAWSLQANSKDKLRMSSRDKLNSAWRLVCREEFSKSEIQRKTSVSTSTIASMRKKLAEIQADYPDKRGRTKNYAAIGMTWGEARHHGVDSTTFDDEAIRKLMINLAEQLGKKFGNQLASNPQITAGALEIYSENMCNQIKGIWASDIAIERQEIEAEINGPDPAEY
jgi:hypothetical protein